MTGQIARTSHPRRQVLLYLATFIAVSPILHSQTTAPAAVTAGQAVSASPGAIRPIAFEIVSIRPSLPGRSQGDFFTDDGYTMHGITPHTLLTYMSKTLSGVPDWCLNERYDVMAKVAEADEPVWKNMSFKQKSRSMQAMLEDRFKLKWHMETKMESGYELVIGKNGSKLKEPTPAELELRAKDPTPGHAVYIVGNRGVGLTGFVGQAASMDLLTYYLQMFAHAPVVDRTGLAGTYDFTLNAAPQPDYNAPASELPVNPAPSLFPAVQGQLGLKLVAGKVPVEYVVVDQIERPTPN